MIHLKIFIARRLEVCAITSCRLKSEACIRLHSFRFEMMRTRFTHTRQFNTLAISHSFLVVFFSLSARSLLRCARELLQAILAIFLLADAATNFDENREFMGREEHAPTCVWVSECHFAKIHAIFHVHSLYFSVQMEFGECVWVCAFCLSWNTMSSAYVVDIYDDNVIISLFVSFVRVRRSRLLCCDFDWDRWWTRYAQCYQVASERVQEMRMTEMFAIIVRTQQDIWKT